MQAFKGIRVLDFTHVFAGPFATYQLAVMGAEVIKIEPPGVHDVMRDVGVNEELNRQGLGSAYIFNNQGKRAITLNLNSPEGKAIAMALIKTADVLVENYTDGLEPFGLGAEQALAVNPRLIYCEMTGFGKDNEFSGRPAYDPVIQAFSGMMSLNGEADQEYLRVGPPLIDYGTGAQAAFAIASALFQRSHSGKGQVIEVNMLDAALVMMSPQVANAIHAGSTDVRTGNVQTNQPGYAVFSCERGDIMIGAYSLAQHRRLFDLLDIGELIDIPEAIDKHWLKAHGEQIRELILQRLGHNSAAHWEEALNQADVPAARIRDLHEMLTGDQLKRAKNSRYQRIEDSTQSAPIAAFRYAEHGPDLNPHCARHGEDNAAVFAELGYDSAAIAELTERGVI
jgi:crotonobetainyl-CoA:carnitine CoA-transferase CaiB-like acyl-CoA transferase